MPMLFALVLYDGAVQTDHDVMSKSICQERFSIYESLIFTDKESDPMRTLRACCTSHGREPKPWFWVCVFGIAIGGSNQSIADYMYSMNSTQKVFDR